MMIEKGRKEGRKEGKEKNGEKEKKRRNSLTSLAEIFVLIRSGNILFLMCVCRLGKEVWIWMERLLGVFGKSGVFV